MIIGDAIRRIRQRAARHTERDRYSPVGVTFHWTMAALVFFQLGWGWRTGWLPAGEGKFAAYDVHIQVGLVLFVLILLRMTWRLFIPGPDNDADKPGVQSVLAHLTHFAFYGLLLALPLTGWAMRSATALEIPMTVGGLVTFPHMPFHGFSPELRYGIEMWAERAHWVMVWALVLLIVAHIGAALKHQIVDKDDVLPAMLPLLDHPDDAPGGGETVRAPGPRAKAKPRRSRPPRAAG